MSDLDIKTNLTKLIAENPDLPIVAFVDTECVPDDYAAWWLCQSIDARIDEYADKPYDSEQLICKSEYEFIDFEDAYDNAHYKVAYTAEDVKEAWDNIEWTKAIILSIGV